MPDQVKVYVRGTSAEPITIVADDSTMLGEDYGVWANGQIWRFYLREGMEWKDLAFRLPGESGGESIEHIKLQKWKLFSLEKAGDGLDKTEAGTNEYRYPNPRFERIGFASKKIGLGLLVLECLLFALSWFFARRHREEQWHTLLPSVLGVSLALTLLMQVALPIQSYIANRSAFPFSLTALCGTVSMRFAVVFAWNTLAIFLLSLCFGRWIMAPFFAFTVCAYLESGILAKGQPSLNGDWTFFADRIRARWDAALWGGVFSLVFVAHHWLKKWYGVAGLCVVVMLAASMLDSRPEQKANTSNLIVNDFSSIETVIRSVTYSTNRNVMVFVIDSLEREQAHAIMEDSVAGPALREQFRGFTENTNNVGALPQTQLAVPNLLTGRYPDGTESMSDFAWSCYGPESAVRDFLETGQDVFMTTEALDCGFSTRTNGIQALSVTETSVLDASGNGGDVWSIRNFTRWRWMPFGAKAIVSDLTDRVIKNATGGMGEWRVFPVLSKAKIDSSSLGTFLWLHTPGVHVPVMWNRYGALLPAENSTDQGCVEQGIFIMEMLGRLFDQYRKLGIYDNSLILVLGNHGAHVEKTFQEDKKAGRLPGNARPCLWVKAPGVAHDFAASGAPTSLSQVAELLKTAAREDLAAREVEDILQSDKRVYRWMAVLGGNWTDWVVNRNGSFTVGEHKASFSSRTDVRPLRCGQRYSLAWEQVKTTLSVLFSKMWAAAQNIPICPVKQAMHPLNFVFRMSENAMPSSWNFMFPTGAAFMSGAMFPARNGRSSR